MNCLARCSGPSQRRSHRVELNDIIMLSISPSYLLYYVPLIIAIALVFGATRHEDTSLILRHSWHTGRWITGFMAIIFAVLFVLDWLA